MPGQPTFVDNAMLDSLSREAAASPRLRMNRNFHTSMDYPCHRLIIALEPGSYIPPTSHRNSATDETILIMRGRIGALLFDSEGQVTEARILDAAQGCLGLTIPHGTFHSFVALESGSVLFESKAGPYAAPEGPERPPWAPQEQAPEAPAYLEWLRAHFIP